MRRHIMRQATNEEDQGRKQETPGQEENWWKQREDVETGYTAREWQD